MNIYQQLMVETEQIKQGDKMPNRELYRIYGKAQMARQLGALTIEEFMTLNHEIIAEGINNPKYF
ncbi:hypothetical protein [Aminipila luticellarii]|uniref:Uncharacterized protein n=1 Tax=Aminipila luticellarii TaxID=2507160 RepID=A0A410PX04_9FIRM|nr:hypothetical protein [Aminipila luticellarii]QAT43471.1 hypothetical protein EQM06_09730 [Aminipila luticellarii]